MVYGKNNEEIIKKNENKLEKNLWKKNFDIFIIRTANKTILFWLKPLPNKLYRWGLGNGFFIYRK